MSRCILASLFTILMGVPLLAHAQDAKPAQPPAGRKLVVGFSQVGAESALRTAETKSIKGEAEKRGIELKLADAQQKQLNQIKAVKSFVAQRVDVIVIAPVVESGWDAPLLEAKAAGIPVILVDRGIKVPDESLYVTLIASDFVEEGRRAAEWLAKKLNDKGNIVELQGTTGSVPAIDRQKGFAEELKKHAGLKIIKSQSGEFTRAGGKQVMEAFIKAEPGNINAVYAHNDDMALGAIQALKEAGLKPGKDVLVVSIDGVHAVLEAIVAGELNASVECNPLMGPKLFDTIEQLRAGKQVPKFIKNDDRFFDQSNTAEAINSREY